MSNTVFHYYISSGEKNKMYTLRVSYQELCSASNGESYPVMRDYYCCNLSINHKKAYAKAQERFEQSKKHAENINSSHEYVLVDKDKVPTLNDIYRRNSEEMEIARRLAEETAKQAQEEREEREWSAARDKIDEIKKGVWPFGKYRGDRFGQEWGKDKPDNGYIHYFIDLNLGKTERDSFDGAHQAVMVSLQNALRAEFPNLANLPVPNGEYYGEIKKRQDFELTPIAEFSFRREAYSPYGGQETVFIQKFVKDTGELIVYMGTSPIDCYFSESIKVKATIKKHEQYKGENQTFIARPKKLENK